MTMLFIKKPPPVPVVKQTYPKSAGRETSFRSRAVKRVLTRLGLVETWSRAKFHLRRRTWNKFVQLPTQPDEWQAFWFGFLDGWVKAFVLVATIWLMWLALILFIGVIL